MFDFDSLENADPSEVSPVRWEDARFADLQCKLLLPAGDVHLVLLFLHGSGQPFEIEQRLFGPKVELLRAAGIAVVLPASPLRDGKLHFWYRTDTATVIDLLQRAKDQHGTGPPEKSEGTSKTTPQSGQKKNPLDLLKDGEPAFLETSRAAILAGIEALRESMQMPLERVALAGFSQGAAAAMDVALHLPKRPAALGFFSGSLMCRHHWRQCLKKEQEWSSIPMVQSHGTGDIAVGVNGGRWMHEFCRDEMQMLNAEYHEFKGGHTIPPGIADRFVEVLLDVAQSGLA